MQKTQNLLHETSNKPINLFISYFLISSFIKIVNLRVALNPPQASKYYFFVHQYHTAYVDQNVHVFWQSEWLMALCNENTPNFCV